MRYKIVACILILSVFSLVLAAPVTVREVREACTDAMEGEEEVIIVSEKRAPRGYEGDSVSDLSDTEWAPSSSQSSSTPGYASGTRPGVGMPSSSSTGSTSPLRSKVSSTPDGTEAAGAFKPGSTTGNQPTSPSEPKSVSLTKVAQQPSPPEIEDVSPLNYFDPSSPPKPQPKGLLSNIKSFFSSPGKIVNFRPRARLQRTVDTAA
jgi:hypothetical protein